MTTITGHTTRANGTILTAAIYNGDHVVHIGNATNLNADKIEGATPPVVDGHGVVFDGTTGSAIRSLGAAPLTGPGGVLPIASGGTGQITAAAAFSALKQTASETVEGTVEMATDGEIMSAATGAKAVMAQDLETAAAILALTDAAPVAVNWDNGINFAVTVTANRQIANPTNGQQGTYRTILVQGNDGTDRTITFGNQYLGDVPVITDCDNAKWYLLTIYCLNSSHFLVSSKRALG